MAEISIIIPVFNTAKYLKECLESIMLQTFSDLEIICVNDGSTDSSLEILEDFANTDSRLKIINQENQGVSAARNAGLKIATSNLVGFLDSDDLVDKIYFAELYSNLNIEKNIGLSLCGFSGSKEMNFKSGIYNLENIESKNLIDLLETGLLFIPYCKLYLRKIIQENKLKFDTEINYGEDLLFNLSYLKKIRIISVSDKILYKYNLLPQNSLAKNYNLKRFIDSDLQVIALKAFLKSKYKNDKNVDKYVLSKAYWSAYDASYYLYNNFLRMDKHFIYQWINAIRNFYYFSLKNTTHNSKDLVKIYSIKNTFLIFWFYKFRIIIAKIIKNER